MRVRTRVAAIFAAFALSLGSLLLGGPAQALTGCHSVMHHSYYEPHYGITFHFYKYECDGQKYYGLMTGKSGTESISVSLTSDPVGGTRYYIPAGYTPPRTSVQTNTVSAGDLVKDGYVCFQTWSGFQKGCYNEYSGGGVAI
jgi:hypothetical protein